MKNIYRTLKEEEERTDEGRFQRRHFSIESLGKHSVRTVNQKWKFKSCFVSSENLRELENKV